METRGRKRDGGSFMSSSWSCKNPASEQQWRLPNATALPQVLSIRLWNDARMAAGSPLIGIWASGHRKCRAKAEICHGSFPLASLKFAWSDENAKAALKAMVSMHARSSWALILVHAIVFEILRDHCIRNMYNEKMLLFVGVKYFINACACECLMVSCSCDIKSISNLLWLSAFERKLITKNHNFVSNNN